jgi:serine/threonine-protein kinase
MLGTPRYMSPEQARGKTADHLSDVYALGVIIHEMLTGEAPFQGPSLDLLLQHAADPPPSMSSVRPDLPEGLDEPVLAMLAKRRADRPKSAGEAVLALVRRARELALLDPAAMSTRPRILPSRKAPASQRPTAIGAQPAPPDALTRDPNEPGPTRRRDGADR